GIDKGKNELAEFKNCKAENVTVEISGSPSKFNNLYFGGLMGHTINDIVVENCSVTGCDFLIGGKSNTMYVGGLVGGCTEGGTIKNSFVKETSIVVEAPWYTTTFGSMTGTSAVQLGGLIGHFDSSGDRFISYEASGEITSSYVSDSKISVSSSGSSLVGGLAGYFYGASISQSYSCNNYVSGIYYDFGKQYYTVGGLVASAKNCAVTSCFSYGNNVFTARKSSGYSVVSSSLVAGFIPSVNSVEANFCGVGMNEIAAKSSEADKLTDERLEEFMFGGTNLNCFVTSPLIANNACNLEAVSESLWYTPQEIKNKLNLTDEYWEFEAEKPPYLNIGK
ncbi:MAG: hypothetical protein K2G26_05800, partial [Clostridia bacterium]|nr:hypothetical protein [Clostridia bacterium]